MKRDLYLTMGCFGKLKLSREEMMKLTRDIGFDGVEGGMLTDEYIELLDKYGLKCVNCSLKQEEDGSVSQDYLDRLAKYNQNQIVGIMDPDLLRLLFDRTHGYRGIPGAFGTFDMAVEAAKKATKTAELAGKYGFQTMYHNHTHEWRVDHGEYVMDTYLRHTPENHVMEFDVGWALAAGIDPIYWMKRWPGRIGALHIKSCNWVNGVESLGMSCPVPPLEEGIGQDQQDLQQAWAIGPQGPMEKSICDWGAIVRGAEEAGCHTFILERERDYLDDIVACVQADHDYLRKCME